MCKFNSLMNEKILAKQTKLYAAEEVKYITKKRNERRVHVYSRSPTNINLCVSEK